MFVHMQKEPSKAVVAKKALVSKSQYLIIFI